MLSFRELSEKKTKIKINPKKEDVMEKKSDGLKKNHGEDCDCMKCDQKRRADDVNDGPDIANEEIKMTRKAYNKLHRDFKSDDPKKPRTTKYVPGKGTVSMPVKFVDEATRYAKETGKSFKSGKPVVKGGTAKDDKAFQVVAKKYASQMMGGPQKKKVRGQKPDESNTPFKRAAARIKQIKVDNKALADKAKKAGYKSTQDYVNVQAVRKGGLGT